MEKNFELIISDDAEWQTLRDALCNYLDILFFEHSKSEYNICFSLLDRLWKS